MLDSDLILNQNLWIGGSGCISPLHHDLSPNFLVQVQGKKKLIIFSPKDNKYLYPGQEVGAKHISEVDLRNVDNNRFPLFNKATPYECILEPGDVLFLPSGWWHEVHTMEASISINYWFRRFDIEKGLELLSVQELYKIIKIFIDKGFKIDSKDCEGEYLLIKAIRYSLPNVVEALLLLGANPNMSSCVYDYGASSVTYAIKRGEKDITEILKKYGASN